jgi:hypothetical protein
MNKKVLGLTLIGCFFLLAASPSVAQELTYLENFPDISADTIAVYFQGDEWTAIWKYTAERPGCVPESLVAVPPVRMQLKTTRGDDRYEITGDTLWWYHGLIADKAFVLPYPTDDALREMEEVRSGKSDEVLALVEKMGPLTATEGRVWFGLSLYDEGTDAVVNGLGWLDLKTERFIRMYSADIGRGSPKWMTAFSDSILILFDSDEEKHEGSNLYLYAVKSGSFFEVDMTSLGIVGERILGAHREGDSLFFATDRGISRWKQGQATRNFATVAIASQRPVQMSLRTFESMMEISYAGIPFATLPPRTPTRVWWKLDDWYEVAVPNPVEGFVSLQDWEAFGRIWQERYWDCPSNDCFARVRIPMKGEIRSADFIHTPLKPLGSTIDGMKVGVDAAWVKAEDVVPILMETKSQP